MTTVLAGAQRDGLFPWPSAGDRAEYAELTRVGLRVILAEYPAYGPRAGELGETAMVADAVAALALVRRQFPGPLLLAGESLGAGVAAAAFAKSPDGVSAVLLITPWDRLENVARHHFPWLPVRWQLCDRYDSSANPAAARVPLAVVIAAQDSIVPAHFGQSLYTQLPAPKRLWEVPGAEHNDWMESVDAAWWRSVIDYLLSGKAHNT